MKSKPEPSYHRITWTNRLIIEKLFNDEKSFRFIAKTIDKAVSSVHTEVQHGLYEHMGAETTRRPFHYSAQIAQDYFDFQATSKGPAVKLDHNHDYANYVSEEIKKGHSPDQITGTLRKNNQWTVSTPTLYRYIDKGYIPNVTNKDLPEKPNRKRKYNTVKASRPPKGTSIERRPTDVSTRNTFGHWEQDSVIGTSKGEMNPSLSSRNVKPAMKLSSVPRAKPVPPPSRHSIT